MKYIRWLTEIRKKDIRQVGSKAVTLGELISWGFPVPAGFCLTTQAYQDFLQTNGLYKSILNILGTTSHEDSIQLEEDAKKIRGLVEEGQIASDIAQEVTEAYQVLGKPPVAIRSSATAEDTPEASFAGLYETYLNVRGGSALLKHIKKCWAGVWTERAMLYCLHQGFDHAEVLLSIIVQSMIPSSISGVMFTINPTTGDKKQIVINAAWGLGKALVDGLVTPDEFIIDKAKGTICQKTITAKNRMVVCRDDSGTSEVVVPDASQTQQSLTKAQLVTLVELGRSIETHYGFPQDIEWAFHEDKPYLLQARPVTAIAKSQPAISWENPVPKAKWIRTWRLGEWLSTPVSPLFETLLVPVLVAAREERRIGHLRWKLPRSWRLKKPWYCIVNGYFFTRAEVNILSFLRFLASAVPTIERAMKRWRTTDLPAYLERVANFQQFNIPQARNSELLTYIEELCRDAGAWWYLVSLNGGAAGTIENILCIFLRKVIKDGNPAVFLRGYENRAFQERQTLYELACEATKNEEICRIFEFEEPSKTLSRLEKIPIGQQFLAKLQSYLERFGHQVSSLDLFFPVLKEQPSRLVPILKSYIAGEAKNPSENLRLQVAQREQAVTEVLQKLKRAPLRRRIFQWLLNKTQEVAQQREDSIFFFQMGWPLMRRVLLELAHRLRTNGLLFQDEDVFFLTKDELWGVARELEEKGSAENQLGELAKERRTRWEWQRQLSAPDRIPSAKHPSWKRKGPKYWGEGGLLHSSSGDKLVGIGASPGQVRGCARVLLSPDDFPKLRKGDILVTVATTPVWTSLFNLASAVVTEVGGVASHASILAREYGIPTVLATGVATKVIKDGQVIMVDGSKGVVCF